MAIAAANSLANYAEKRGLTTTNIIPTMDEAAVFPTEAADVAMAAIKDGVARVNMTWQEAFDRAKKDIESSRAMTDTLSKAGFIAPFPEEVLQACLHTACEQVLQK